MKIAAIPGMPAWMKVLILIAILGIFQLFILSLTNQNTQAFDQLKRSIR